MKYEIMILEFKKDLLSLKTRLAELSCIEDPTVDDLNEVRSIKSRANEIEIAIRQAKRSAGYRV